MKSKMNWIKLYKPGFILNKFHKIFKSRASFYRILFIFTGLNIGNTLLNSYLKEPEIIMSVTDYLENDIIKENNIFDLYGVIKPGSLTINNFNNNYFFKVTDFINEVDIIYKGLTTIILKEGDNILLKAYCPNLEEKYRVISTGYQNSHSMVSEKWEGSSGKKRADIIN